MSHIIATTEDDRFRVRLVRDEAPANPREHGSGRVHVLTIDTHLGRYLPVDADGGPLAAAWDRLKWDRWKGVETFIRYVSIMHGGIVLESAPQSGPRSLWYMTGDEILALDAGLLTEGYVEAEMEEYEAWAEGDVWGYVIEEYADWTRDGRPDESMTTWGEVDSGFDLYGGPWARACAREALAHHVARSACRAA
ncbi:hypothetical protein [Streptomyces exfoliatus]|uniref:hypothetical protein n=1 Tax=Streptomyces exfoliatus TaxID=1905 RepID=UPI0037A03299